MRFELKIGDVPFGHWSEGWSALPSTATTTSSARARTNIAPSGIFSRLEEPSISSSQVELESSNVELAMLWKGYKISAVVRVE